jgi:flagella basal body P-ring formation protein FlgA
MRSQKLASAFYCLLLTAYCLLFAGIASAAKGDFMDTVKQAVLKELKSSISEDVELYGLRIIKGMDAVDKLNYYTVSEVVMTGYNGRNRVNFMVYLMDKKKEKERIIVEASYDVLMDVFITARPLAKGETLTDEDFYVVKQKSSRLPAGAILNKDDIKGKILKTNIGHGIVIRSDYLTNQLSIKRGQKINVVLEGNNVAITTQGVLRNDASVGGVAKVLCDATKKEVSGILISADTVRVKI